MCAGHSSNVSGFFSSDDFGFLLLALFQHYSILTFIVNSYQKTGGRTLGTIQQSSYLSDIGEH